LAIGLNQNSDKAERKHPFFNRTENYVKTLTFSGYTKHGQFWRWSKMTMINHHYGKSTELVFSDWKFTTGLKVHDFKSSALEHQL
jgi:hypothetical protein